MQRKIDYFRPRDAEITQGRGNRVQWQDAAGVLIFGALILLALAVFLMGLWAIYKFVVLLLLTPRTISESGSAAKIVAALVALALTPPLLTYILSVCSSLFDAIPSLIDSLFSSARLAAENCSPRCNTDVLRPLGSSLTEIVGRILSSLNLGNFPLTAFVIFLLIFSIGYYSFVWIEKVHLKTRENAAQSILINLAFLTLVLFSFYLCLSALLAIPLMQTQVVAQGFTADDLDKAITADLPTKESFDSRFPALSLALQRPRDGQDAVPIRIKELVDRTMEQVTALIEQTNATRDSTFQEILRIKSSAVSRFRIQNTQRLGGRQTIDHYGAVYNWVQEERRRMEVSLANCLQNVGSYVRQAAAWSDSVSGPRQTNNSVEIAVGPEDGLDDAYSRYYSLLDSYFESSSNCGNAQTSSLSVPPDRPTRGSSLKLIGKWTDWLLDTDTLPLVIIVGLVGFSLLGATISRVVRAGADAGFTGLVPADLLTVIAGGVAAALVVFLASYGSLAILGEAATDPSPYVVFAACLVGAIFSEDVWVAARARFLAKLTDQSAEGDADTLVRSDNNAHTSPAEPEGKPSTQS